MGMWEICRPLFITADGTPLLCSLCIMVWQETWACCAVSNGLNIGLQWNEQCYSLCSFCVFETYVVFGAKFSDFGQVALIRNHNPGFSLDGLNHESRNVRVLKGFLVKRRQKSDTLYHAVIILCEHKHTASVGSFFPPVYIGNDNINPAIFVVFYELTIFRTLMTLSKVNLQLLTSMTKVHSFEKLHAHGSNLDQTRF